VIGPGERIPSVEVWGAPSTDPIRLETLAAEGAILLLFYLYDWSTT
jgi:hypothetical protein